MGMASSWVETDMLTNLPEDLKEKILTYLPLKEAGRTSILSRKWQFTWSSIPKLDLAKTENIPDLVKFVDTIFVLHTGPIRGFHLSASQQQHNPQAFDRWILNLSRNGIRELCLDLNVQYKMNSRLFVCDQLNHVDLTNCSFKVPNEFKGFKFLLTLALEKVNVPEGVIEKLISHCPILKRLIIVDLMQFISLEIHSPSLQSLEIGSVFKDLQIRAPKLLSLSVRLECEHQNNTRKRIQRVLGNLPDLESFEMIAHFIKYLYLDPSREGFPFTFNRLKNIDMDLNFEDEKEAEFILTLFRGVPHLESLQIYAYLLEEKPTLPSAKVWENVDGEEDLFKCLKTVDIDNYRPVDSVFSFVKFVLASAPQLESLYMDENPDYKDECLELVAQILDYETASADVGIYY